MNTSLDTTNKLDLEINLNAAMNLSSHEHTYDELIDLLSSDIILEKQLAALELTEIKSKKDAKVLVSNLIGQDGKVREAVAFKINELALNNSYTPFFIDPETFNVFLQGIMDINGNVCRQIVDLTIIKEFQEYLCEALPKSISQILENIKKLEADEKQYVISKRNFQLYWALEALCNIIDVVDIAKVSNLLLLTGEFSDYTIREKAAKILSKIGSTELNKLREKLKNDENYYVRRYLE